MVDIPQELAEQFKRVCPEWARHILGGRFDPDSPSFVGKDKRRWNIKWSFCCIVGEAHKRQAYHGIHQPAYGCNRCACLSQDLVNIPDSDWPDILSKFLNHYEKEHPMEVAAKA